MIELLAPVGNIEALKAAIYSGADAVYLGFGKFNARQKADGFNENNLKEAVDLCHLYGVKVYITFNTLIKNSEFNDFEKDVQCCVDANVDAFIVTDLGTLDIFKKYDIPLHTSTQMGIHNYEGAKIAKELGFTRVVLSREALISDIKKIKTLDIEIEYFVHGALCVSFSGGCLLSSYLSGDSGNRGLCKQPCRLKYMSSITKNEKYYLSPSDQCMIDKIKELSDAGVDSFKIEGRLKSSQYVGEVVNQYRKMINGTSEKDYMSWLRKAYNRGSFTQGYNFDNTKNIMSPNVQGNMGEYIGNIVKKEGKTLFIQSERGVYINDGFKIFNNDEEIGGFKVDNCKKEGNLYKVNTIKTYPIGSKVYLTLDEQLNQKYANAVLSNPVVFEYKMKEGENFELKATSNSVSVLMTGDVVDTASNVPLSKENIESKLSEINGTGFKLEEIFGEISSKAFYPMSKIKAAKRDILANLIDRILEEYNKNKIRIIHTKSCLNINNDIKLNKILCEIDSLDKLTNKMINQTSVLYSISDDLASKIDYIMKSDLNHNNLEKIILKLPKILRGSDNKLVRTFIENNIDSISGFMCENIYGLEFSIEYNKPAILGLGMNVYNDFVHKTLNVQNYIFSSELSKDDFKTNSNAYVFAYGRIPLMTFTHCPIQLNTNCTCQTCKYIGPFSYTLSNNKYLVKREKLSYCYFNLLNSKVTDLRSVEGEYKCKNYIDLKELKDKSTIDFIIDDFISKNGTTQTGNTLGHFNLIVR